MTNSNCISDVIKKNNNLSFGVYLQGVFQTKYGLTKARCKKIIHASDISQLTVFNVDYAQIELEEIVENALTFNLGRRGVTENEKIEILTMNHHQISSGIYSDFKEHHCVMKSSDLWGKINFSGASPLPGFKKKEQMNFAILFKETLAHLQLIYQVV